MCQPSEEEQQGRVGQSEQRFANPVECREKTERQ